MVRLVLIENAFQFRKRDISFFFFFSALYQKITSIKYKANPYISAMSKKSHWDSTGHDSDTRRDICIDLKKFLQVKLKMLVKFY